MADQALRTGAVVWSVPGDLKTVRLDSFARRCLPHLSRRTIEQAIGEGLFTINGKPGKKGDKLESEDRLMFNGPEPWLSTAPIANPRLQVPMVYEDATLLVVDKPAGLPTHGFSGRDTATLANFLAAKRPLVTRVGNSRWENGVVHRLDHETSGLVLVAKTQAAFENLRLQFRRGGIRKVYWALVWGITPAEGSISYALAHDPGDKRRMRPMPGGWKPRKKLKGWRALTRFRKIDDARGLSLLEVEMESGVTHQIRVHLASIGHPLVGDTLYGEEHQNRLGLTRHFLHAAQLEFAHPLHGRVVKLKAPLPGDLRLALKRFKLRI